MSFTPNKVRRARSARNQAIEEDRRRASRDASPSLDQIRADLRTRLLVQQNEQAVQVLRPLVVVHEELRHRDGVSVGKLPADVLGKDLEQALMLQSDDPSAPLGVVIERLRLLRAAADVEADRRAPVSQPAD